MHSTLVLLICLGYLCMLLGANCQEIITEKPCNDTLQAVEELFRKKGLNPDQLASTVVEALTKSSRQTSKLLDLILGKFKDCKVAASIVGALETSDASIARLHQLLSAHASHHLAYDGQEH